MYQVNICKNVIWLTRGKKWGFRFLSTGPFPESEAQRIYSHIFESTSSIPLSKSGCGYSARRFFDNDPSLTDESGRQISHDVIILLPRGVQTEENWQDRFLRCVHKFYVNCFNDMENVIDIPAEMNFYIKLKQIDNEGRKYELMWWGMAFLIAICIIVVWFMMHKVTATKFLTDDYATEVIDNRVESVKLENSY